MMPLIFRSFGFFILGSVLILTHCTPAASIDCQELIISPIANQRILADTRCYIPLAVLANNLDKVKFTITDGPKFITIDQTQRGRAILILDPSTTNLGEYSIKIEASDDIRNGCTTFIIRVVDSDQMGRTIHCDPSQIKQGNGSAENPYGSLGHLMASGFLPQANDLIILHKGNHEDVTLTGSTYTIVANKGDVARLYSLQVQNTQDVNIYGLNIRPKKDHGDHNKYLVFIDSASHHINFSNNLVMSTDDASQWTVDDWNKRASRGIKCIASQSVIENNLVQHVFHGIKTEGNNITVRYNHVDRFGGDAIRNTGSQNSYSYNFLTNATVDDYYDEGGNHDDLFQSWTFDDPIDQISLSNNIMISCLDTLMPQRAKIVQGLVCFDGFETNWVVANNLVVTDHPHGIALYGAKNCKIYENTVLKNPYALYQFESDPWIMVNNHKDGRRSKNNVVRNNTVSALNIVSKDVAVSENLILDSSTMKKLNNYHEWDFRIKE